ncbi:MAG: NAD-dependent 4,6-dehydratase LegB [Rhodobacteraceae bacterium]|nr:NAD-dependent 4,6-dehydratase LegB [Paracoccaceae bacterium]MCF8521046.1 NAD-dependent 4,6-dehydratase LegB [Paracoccaceae bacterium]
MAQVLVTVANGFIGSHLVEMLAAEGHQLRALAQYNSFNSWGWLDHVACRDQIEVVSGDVRDAQFCNSVARGIETVFHLAALIAIPYSYAAPDSYIETNVRGTLNVCQAALNAGCIRVIHASTSEVCGTAQYVPMDEAHPLQPQSPYSASKIGADAIAMSFFNAFDLPLTIARPFNTYGPRQSAHAVILTIITQIEAGAKEIKLGDLSPTRDFNYVADTCAGFVALAGAQGSIGQTVNIGSNFEISVGDTLRMIRDIMGSDVEFVQDEVRMRPGKSEVFRLWCNNSRIRDLAGFAPAYTIRIGLEAMVEWFLNPANLAGYNADRYDV